MKRIVIILIILSASVVTARAQDLIYRGFNQQESYNDRSSTQTVSATAYSRDSYGNLVKMPIRIQLTTNAYGQTTARVVQKYVSNGLGGGWAKVLTSGQIQQCQSIFATSGNSLENSFMYKVSIDTRTWYFDM